MDIVFPVYMRATKATELQEDYHHQQKSLLNCLEMQSLSKFEGESLSFGGCRPSLSLWIFLLAGPTSQKRWVDNWSRNLTWIASLGEGRLASQMSVVFPPSTLPPPTPHHLLRKQKCSREMGSPPCVILPSDQELMKNHF